MISTESTRCCPDLRRASACFTPPGPGSSPRRESLASPTPPTDLSKSPSGRHRRPASKGLKWLPRALFCEVDHIVRCSAVPAHYDGTVLQQIIAEGIPSVFDDAALPRPAQPVGPRPYDTTRNASVENGPAIAPGAGFYNQVDVRRWRRSRRQRDDVRPIERMIQWQPTATPWRFQPQVVQAPPAVMMCQRPG